MVVGLGCGMRCARVHSILRLVLLVMALWTVAAAQHRQAVVPAGTSPTVAPAVTTMPVSAPLFVKNCGQWPAPVLYQLRACGVTTWVERDGWILSRAVSQPNAPRRANRLDDDESHPSMTRSAAISVAMRFEGSAAAGTAGEDLAASRFNYFIGNDPAGWRTDVPGFARVRWREMRPGVDVVARQGLGFMEYDLVVAAGVDPGAVIVRCDGISRLSLEGDGSLIMPTPAGDLRQSAPKAHQVMLDGTTVSRPCRFQVIDDVRFAFRVDGADPSLPLVIDPGLTWGTWLGGTGDDDIGRVEASGNGDLTLLGSSSSVDYPATVGAFQPSHAISPTGANRDMVISRTTQNGASFVWSTFIGGMCDDGLGTSDLALVSGDVVVCGNTPSFDFPVTPGAFQTTCCGSCNANFADLFVLRLAAAGNALIWSTFLGAPLQDQASAIAVTATGTVIVVGTTRNPTFPVTPGAYSTTFVGGFVNGSNPTHDAFVSELSANGSTLLHSTFLGTNGTDSLKDVVVDSQGQVWVAGWTSSAQWPVAPGSFDPTFNGGSDGVLLALDPTLSTVVYGTFLGGSANDEASGLAVDSLGRTVVIGRTSSSDFPTTAGAFDTTWNGYLDVFALRLDNAVTSLGFSTYLGGSGNDYPADAGIALTQAGEILIAGQSGSTDLPTPAGGYYAATATATQVAGFLYRLSAEGDRLTLGATLGTGLGGCAIDPSGAIVGVGSTSAGFGFAATAGSLLPSPPGALDGFLFKLDGLPTGVTRYGAPTAGCLGLPVGGVSSMPQPGNAGFSLTCSGLPALSSGGVLGISAAVRPTPLMAFGASIWIDPQASVFLAVPVTSNALGVCEVGLPIPPSVPVGAFAYGQFAWADPCAPGGVSASAALSVTVQP